MKKFLVTALIAAIALVPALAQDNTPDAGSLGITANIASNKTSIGAVYHVSDVFALRPWIGFESYGTNVDDTYPSDDETSYFTIGTDALYEMKLAESFLLGLGGRIGYSKSSVSEIFATYDDVETDSYLTLTALASAQYFFNPVVGIFADFGIGMQTRTHAYEVGVANNDGGYTSIRLGLTTSALGVVFYVK